MKLKKYDYLYVGLTENNLKVITAKDRKSKDLKLSYICAAPSMGLAVLLGLNWSDKEAEIEEHGKKLTFTIKEKIETPTIYLYMVPSTGFQRLDPESDLIWVTNSPVVALDKQSISEPLNFAENRGITIIEKYKQIKV